jgi:ferrous iron transport protein A
MIRLGELRRGVEARVLTIDTDGAVGRRLLEMGVIEGCTVEVVHEAPWSRDPIAIRARGTTIALRRADANRVMVELVSAPGLAQHGVSL